MNFNNPYLSSMQITASFVFWGKLTFRRYFCTPKRSKLNVQYGTKIKKAVVRIRKKRWFALIRSKNSLNSLILTIICHTFPTYFVYGSILNRWVVRLPILHILTQDEVSSIWNKLRTHYQKCFSYMIKD